MESHRLSLERMKAIDLYLGLPMCAALGALSHLFPALFWRRHDDTREPRRIVVMKFFGLGSITLAGPALRAIRERYPDARLIFLTFDGPATLVRRMNLFDSVWVVRTDSIVSFARDVWSYLARLRREPPDVCIDLEFFSKFSTLMTFLTRAPVRVAFHLNSFWRSSAVNRPVYYNYYRHVRDVYDDAAAAIGAPVTNHSPVRLAVEPQLSERCRQYLEGMGWNGSDRLVGVNVNAAELAHERRWPRERFASVLERLTAEPGVRPVVTGAADDVDYVAGVVDLVSDAARPGVLNMAGHLSFEEFIAMLGLFDFYLTNDSGPLHLAVSQNVDTISLWGVGRPSFYGPHGERHSTLYREFHCSPCLYMFTSQAGQWCDHRGDCLRAIEVEEVWDLVKAYLDIPREQRARIACKQGW